MARALSILTLAGFVAIGAGGCRSAPPPPPGTSVFSKGALRATVEKPLDDVVPAVNQALKTLRLKPMTRSRDGFSALIVGDVSYGAGESSEIRVEISRLTDATTEIQMRILFRRDEARMRQVLDEVEKNLKEDNS